MDKYGSPALIAGSVLVGGVKAVFLFGLGVYLVRDGSLVFRLVSRW